MPLSQPLALLANYGQFILHRDKRPVGLDLNYIDPHDPANWLTYQQAEQYAPVLQAEIGFVFTANDPFFFLDLDKCFVNGRWSELAQYLCGVLSGCAVEISRSGVGLHIIGISKPVQHACKNVQLGIELYTEKRFVAITDYNTIGNVGTDATEVLQQIINMYFPPQGKIEHVDWTDKPCAEWNGYEDDQQLIEAMLKTTSAANIFGNKAAIRDLWGANETVLSGVYPSPSGNPFDHSSADAALCAHLAFWTGKNCDRMDRLFRQSNLMRDKWELREDYRYSTIVKAVGNCANVYAKRKREPQQQPESVKPNTKPAAQLVYKTGYQFISPDDQVELFKGCVYVEKLNRVFTPSGALLKQEQFKVMYGGYIFNLDTELDKTTTNAWTAFTESQAVNFPKVKTICFRPDLAEGAIIKDRVNIYIDKPVELLEGDPAPFFDFLSRILPNERDRVILVSYMAACVQHKGVKFQWAPLVQGVEGNGKSLLIRVMTHAIDEDYTHLVNPKDIDNKFNAWVLGKIFAGIEEIYIQDRFEAVNALKPLITNDRIEIQAKGADQVTSDNRANFMLCTNHKDAIRKSQNDRRYCVFFTAQQSLIDIKRCGMGGDYFPDMYNWLKNGGYKIVANFLHTYAIPEEFNPATHCHRAPETSTTAEAMELSLGRIEQEILTQVEQGTPGFIGGWISSIALDRLLKSMRDDKRISRHRRAEILEELGYIKHPNLDDGRSPHVIPIDGGRPRLWIKKGHINCNITNHNEIIQKYAKDQGDPIELNLDGAVKQN